MSLDLVMLIGAAVLLVAVMSSRVGSRLGLPSLLLFLGVGMALDPFGLHFSDPDLAHALGFAALVFILGEGGLATRWEDIRGSLRLAGLLATLGVVVSVGLVAAFAHYVFSLSWAQAVLLGAVTAPTDSAAIFAVMRSVPLPAHIRSTLEGESGLNDAPIVLLVGMATAWAAGSLPEGGPVAIAALVLVELAGGIVLGLGIGFAAAWLLKRVAFPASGLFVLAVMGFIVLSYGLGVLVHVSGFAAVYVCAVVLGNSGLAHRQATKSFAEGIGWIAQIGLFVMLGMLSNPFRITTPFLVEGLVVGAFLTLVARPVSVFVCAVWFRLPLREMAFISWAGLRGAVPIIMATVPLAAGIPESAGLFDAVLVLVIVYTVVQAPSLQFVARLLGVSSGDDPVDIEVEVAPLDKIQADFMQIRVPKESKLQGVTVQELRLPPLTMVAVLIRNGQPRSVESHDRILVGDELMIVVPSRLRTAVEERFKQVSEHGRLASWLPTKSPQRRDADPGR
ncbi:potassium/proton antiporter [Nigerium massiliense]|uniref:potassium/proton antiporter n=1 Tax=Nigerium massiliense TaxID=1522317 RepID=UPI000B2CEA1D|nr:potassium/proton antiporter [Nigerium massiliense]